MTASMVIVRGDLSATFEGDGSMWSGFILDEKFEGKVWARVRMPQSVWPLPHC